VFNVGTQELLLILLLVFVLFGPRHIPDIARTLGKGLGDLQRTLRGVEDSVRRSTEVVKPDDFYERHRAEEGQKRPLASVEISEPADGPEPATGAGERPQTGAAPPDAGQPAEGGQKP